MLNVHTLHTYIPRSTTNSELEAARRELRINHDLIVSSRDALVKSESSLQNMQTEFLVLRTNEQVRTLAVYGTYQHTIKLYMYRIRFFNQTTILCATRTSIYSDSVKSWANNGWPAVRTSKCCGSPCRSREIPTRASC